MAVARDLNPIPFPKDESSLINENSVAYSSNVNLNFQFASPGLILNFKMGPYAKGPKVKILNISIQYNPGLFRKTSLLRSVFGNEELSFAEEGPFAASQFVDDGQTKIQLKLNLSRLSLLLGPKIIISRDTGRIEFVPDRVYEHITNALTNTLTFTGLASSTLLSLGDDFVRAGSEHRGEWFTDRSILEGQATDSAPIALLHR